MEEHQMIRVLIVDDDKLARKGLMSIMPWQKWGMTVVGEAPNGLKALEFLERETVDLMFVDISMPVLSGIELMQQARELYPALQFVVLTFHEDFDYVQTCIRLGALDYISKLKMETEDYNSIFERIAIRMGQLVDRHSTAPADMHHSATPATAGADATPTSTSTSASTPASASASAYGPARESDGSAKDSPHQPLTPEKMEQRWLGLEWLFDDLGFDTLCEQTLAHPQPQAQGVALLSRALAGAEQLTRLPVDPGIRMTSISTAIQSVRHYRTRLHAHAAQTDDLSVTAICMIKSAQYIQNHMTDPLHTEAVSSHVNMSRSYFCQCFKRQFGQTFNEYVRSRRIHLAKEYLLKTQQPISWIAQAVGYGDIKYFSHVFREQEQALPSEYRARHGHGDG